MGAGFFNVLVVDDNKHNLMTIEEVLKQNIKLNIVSALNGNEALELAVKKDFQLFILDIQLPDIDGYEIARFLKSRKKTMNIPIIFSTAIYRSDEYVKKGYQIGAVDYLFKPIKEEELLNKVSFYVRNFEAQQELNEKIIKTNEELREQNKLLSELKDSLESNRNQWRDLGKALPQRILIIDNEDIVKFTNGGENYADKKYYELLPKIDSDEVKNAVKECFVFRKPYVCDIKIDEKIWAEMRVMPMENRDTVMVIFEDITDRKKSQERIEYIGYHDQLTTLYNRHYIDEVIDDLLKEENLPLSMIMCDISGLKLINDAFGHTAGDELISESAQVLKSKSPDGSIVARWGGDEFIILLPKTQISKADKCINKYRKEFANTQFQKKFVFTMSFGSFEVNDSNTTFEDALKEAENRMYLNKLNNVRKNSTSIMNTLRNSLQEKNFETSAHTDRMEKLVLEMGRRLNLRQHELDNLVLLTSLHDIGKIAVSDAILLKPADLTKEEKKEIEKHCEVGYRICLTIPELTGIAHVILSHHENWDGTGYPQGLKGKEIPYLSRIITIVDAYDVMTNERPYHEMKTHKEAMKELKNCSGTQFDPELVNIFFDIFDESPQ